MRIVLGVDEAGRGPLAGPVAVGVVAALQGFDVAREFPGVADSKLLPPERREMLFTLLEARAARGDVRFVVEFEDERVIDRHGIVYAVRCALSRGVRALAPCTENVLVRLDGRLKAPEEYAQETIIRGDRTVPLISLASIAAKVTRDRRMTELSKRFPAYGFERHKGYGTAEHYRRLRAHGPSIIHRRSYLHLDFVRK